MPLLEVRDLDACYGSSQALFGMAFNADAGMWLEHESCKAEVFVATPRFVNGGHTFAEGAEMCPACGDEMFFDPGAEW